MGSSPMIEAGCRRSGHGHWLVVPAGGVLYTGMAVVRTAMVPGQPPDTDWAAGVRKLCLTRLRPPPLDKAANRRSRALAFDQLPTGKGCWLRADDASFC